MIAEIHISSPPAAFDYHQREKAETPSWTKNQNLNVKTFQTGTVWQLRRAEKLLSKNVSLSGSLLFSLTKEQEQSFQISCGWFVFSEIKTFFFFQM